jgi:spore coat polysaccharide biosynthesis protein SpsF
MNASVLCVTQARIGSTRLPGKVLLPLRGEPMLWWHLTRLQRAQSLDRIIVATTDEPGADAITDIAATLGIDAIIGPVADVLGRFDLAVSGSDAGIIVRVTSDCPLIDPTLIDWSVESFRSAELGYLALDVSRFPRGLDCEVMTRAAFAEAVALATDPADREHVTPYIRRHSDRFPARYLAPPSPIEPDHWCVDTPEDFAYMTRIIEQLGDRAAMAGWQEIAHAVQQMRSNPPETKR